MAKRIVCTPGTCDGEPRIEGHRLTCANVVLNIDYRRFHSYLKDYPDLTADDIKACLTYCANQKCIQDYPENFCFRCVLGTTSDELDGEEPVNIWEKAREYLENFDILSHSED